MASGVSSPQLLVEAGFTPAEAVRIATSNGAIFLGGAVAYLKTHPMGGAILLQRR